MTQSPIQRSGTRGKRASRPDSVVPDAAPASGGASIYDVAEYAGVSIVTVSRVFNDYPHVSAAMRERVYEAARQIGYKPRLTSKRAVIAILSDRATPMSSRSRHSRILLHIIRVAAARGYLVEFIPMSTPELATKHLVNGVIAIGLPTRSLLRIENLPAVPRIAINQPGLDGGWSTVDSDAAAEGEDAARHLIEAGHRRIAVVVESRDNASDVARVDAIRAALSRCADAPPPAVLLSDGRPPELLAHQIAESRCTASILLCETTGLRVVDALRRAHGLRIPEDLSVIAIEDDPASSVMQPAMTSLVAPLDELAEFAVEVLLRQVEQELPCRVTMRLRSTLMARGSVAAPSRGG